MRFEQELLLLGLLPLVFLWWFARRRSSEERRRFPLLVGCLTCLLLALANPYWSYKPERRVVRSADLVLILDVSQSMFCPAEGQLRRIDQARTFLRGFLPHFAGSPISVVYFAGDAQIGCPLTTDLQAVHLFLDSITPGMSASAGTRSKPLVRILQDLLQDTSRQQSSNPIGLLFSDGEFFDSTKELENWLEEHRNFAMFSFGTGTGKNPVPKFDLSGPYPNAVSEVQPGKLERLGTAFSLSSGESEKIGREVLNRVGDVLSKGEEAPDYQFLPFLILAFLFLLTYEFYPSIRKIALFLAPKMAILLVLVVSLSMKSEEDKLLTFQQAVQETKEKKYEKALEKLLELKRQSPSDQIEIAIGNVYFHQQKFDHAIDSYKQALTMNPGSDSARWNWEVALKKKSQPERPPEAQSTVPKELPDEAKALLRYFDQLEKEQMRSTNSINANTNSFAW